MIDFARITVKAGDGGDGSGSFLRIKNKRYGKADGGDGGRGGNVYVEATRDLSSLEPYRYVKNYQAASGANGFPNRRRGADGEDLVLKVPVGTVVKVTTDYSLQTTAKSDLATAVDSSQWTVDLVDDNQRILIACGGEGGRGNAHLRDEFGRRPKVGERGQAGELAKITLELKLIADVGLIGLPNAGKSTLLAKLTRAAPKIAPYPFTTLEPNLGVLIAAGPVGGSSHPILRQAQDKLGQFTSSEVERLDGTPSAPATRIIIADIPGLIEGASRGRGLGDLFLRHIERTRLLVHLIDVSTSTNKWQDYQTIRGELKAYSGELAKKPEIVVLTKIDLVDRQAVAEAAVFFGKKRKKVIAISAQTGEGLDELVAALVKAVAR